MKLRVALCDDEAPEIEYLRPLVLAWAQKRGHSVTPDAFPGAEPFLFAYETEPAYDILLLDIQMKALDGVTLAKRIRSVNKEIQIIFITGYMDYIADGYEVEALHYLLKPAPADKLFSVLDRAVEKLKRNERALLLSCAGEQVRVPLYEIRYLEVCKNYVTVHAGENHMVKKTLRELEEELDDRFFRVGRSFIVNLHTVRKVLKTQVSLSDGTVIPLSKGFYEPLNRALIARL